MTTDTKTESTDEIIARRSADIDATRASNNEHRKVFVLPPGPKPTEKNGYDHRANMAATRQYAISQGMRPTDDVRHVSTAAFGPGGKSWALTYAVPVQPVEKIEGDEWREAVEVEVITDNETDTEGHVPNATGDASDKPTPTPEPDADAAGKKTAK